MTKPTLTTYGGRLRDLGYAGQVANTNPITTVTLANESATAIDFGVAVARGAADDTCKPIGLDADKIIGISIRNPIRPADASNNVTIAQYDEATIMREGDIYAAAYENVTRGDQVLSITAQAGKLGGVTGGAAGAGRVVVPGAVWDTTTTAGNIGRIRINS